jgi:hypothetical protein
VIGLLQSIVDFMVCWIQTGATLAANGIVFALGILLAGLVAASPVDMPAPPTMPTAMTDVLGWVAWVFPVGTAVSILAFFVTAWIAWQIIALVLRWVRAL